MNIDSTIVLFASELMWRLDTPFEYEVGVLCTLEAQEQLHWIEKASHQIPNKPSADNKLAAGGNGN